MENIENSRKSTSQTDEIAPEILLNPEETAIPKSIKTKLPRKANPRKENEKENEKEKEKHKINDTNANPKKEKHKTNATNKR